MKINKIGDIILWLIFTLVVFNTIIAYVSYKKVINKKEPLFSFKIIKKDNKIIYNEALYKIIVNENDKTREVSLKLFFLK